MHSDDHEDCDREFELNTAYYVLAWIRTISFIFIVLPFVIYCIWIMWKDKNKLYVKKRRPIIILILIILNLSIDFRMFIMYIYNTKMLAYCLPVYSTILQPCKAAVQ